MILNEAEIKARDERLELARVEMQNVRVMHGRHRTDMEETLTLLHSAIPRRLHQIPGLFGRLAKGKPLTATQFYHVQPATHDRYR